MDKLIETYKKSERHSILHTLSLYVNVLELDNTSLFKSHDDKAVTMDSVFLILQIYSEKVLRVVIILCHYWMMEPVMKINNYM